MRSTAAAEILAAGEALEEVVLLKKAHELVHGTALSLNILVDAKDILKRLSTCLDGLVVP